MSMNPPFGRIPNTHNHTYDGYFSGLSAFQLDALSLEMDREKLRRKRSDMEMRSRSNLGGQMPPSLRTYLRQRNSMPRVPPSPMSRSPPLPSTTQQQTRKEKTIDEMHPLLAMLIFLQVRILIFIPTLTFPVSLFPLFLNR